MKTQYFLFLFLSTYSVQSYAYFVHSVCRFQTSNKDNVGQQNDYRQHPNKHRIIHGKSVSQEFMDNVFRDKPIINPMSRSMVSSKPDFDPVLQEGGLLTSFELYATSSELQTFVISQISNWIRGGNGNVLPYGSYSVLFASIDGKRLVHMIGWRNMLNEQNTENSFNDFRRKASLAADGLPLDLKESTHIYKPIYSIPEGVITSFSATSVEKYPLFAIDFYTVRLLEDQMKVKDALKKAVSALDKAIPELVSTHLLGSTDRLVHTVLSTWTSIGAKDSLNGIEEYKKHITDAKRYAIEGSITDIVERSEPSRLYIVADVFIP